MKYFLCFYFCWTLANIFEMVTLSITQIQLNPDTCHRSRRLTVNKEVTDRIISHSPQDSYVQLEHSTETSF